MSTKSKSKIDTDIVVALCVAIAGAAYCYNYLPTQSELKEFETFQSFYPFYISQHQDQTCARLHVFGTTILAGILLLEPKLLLALGIAISLGTQVFQYTRHFPRGEVEGIATIMTFLISSRYFTKSWVKGVLILVICYGFAWVGHFMFEKNRPATFIYPTYSLLGDLTLWFETVTLARQF